MDVAILPTHMLGQQVIAVTGEIDVHSATELHSALQTLINEGHLCLILDLSGTTFLGSTGLSTLIMARKQVIARDGWIRIVSPTPSVSRIFDLTGLAEVFPIFDELAAAQAASDVPPTAPLTDG